MTEALPENLQEFGEEILKQLDMTSYRPTSMLWSDTVKENEWVLMIAVKLSSDNKSISKNRILYFKEQVYNQIMNIIQKLGRPDLNFNLVVVPHNEPFLKLIGEFVSTEADTVASIKFNNNTINGINTGSNYIYRISL